MTEGIIIALIMAGFGLIGSAVNGVMIYKSKRLRNNPYPCKENRDKIDENKRALKQLDDKLDKACEDISRIQGRLNERR